MPMVNTGKKSEKVRAGKWNKIYRIKWLEDQIYLFFTYSVKYLLQTWIISLFLAFIEMNKMVIQISNLVLICM